MYVYVHIYTIIQKILVLEFFIMKIFCVNLMLDVLELSEKFWLVIFLPLELVFQTMTVGNIQCYNCIEKCVLVTAYVIG